jgi:anthranilate 1,2-dioxygenase small subunit
MSSPVKARADADLNLLREVRQQVEEFNLEYCRVLDEGRIEEWPNFFTEDPLYRITGRENFDGGFPLGVMYCDSIGMMKDRAYAIAKTLVFSPRYLRHYITNTRIVSIGDDHAIESEANYLVLQTQLGEPTIIFQSGRYVDRFIRSRNGLLLKERHCVYDSTIIDTDLVFPV